MRYGASEMDIYRARNHQEERLKAATRVLKRSRGF